MKLTRPRGPRLAMSVVRLTASIVALLFLLAICMHDNTVPAQPGITLAKSKFASSTSTYSSPVPLFNGATTTTAAPAAQ